MIDVTPIEKAAGLVRNLGLVLRRTGLGGFGALVADRATPHALAYRRTFVLRADCVGEPHPELAPRRLRSLEPDLPPVFAEIARTREPDVQPMTESDLQGRFARGHELWLFHAAGRIAHLRWVLPGPLALTGLMLPLTPDERIGEESVTLPAVRRRGLARMATLHVRHVLGREGIRFLYGYVRRSNARWHSGMLRMGYAPVATEHLLAVAGRGFVKVVAASPSERKHLEQRGVQCGRWTRAL